MGEGNGMSKEDIMKEVIQMVANPYNYVYQPIEHPYFANWEVTQICIDRLQTILEYTGNVKGKRILDIGFQIGWFCHKLAKLGARVTGLELSNKNVNIAYKLSAYYGFPQTNPEFIGSRYEDYLKEGDSFDIILYLSNFHHELRDLGPETAWKNINLISKCTNLMFLDMDEHHVTEWMRRWSGYQSAKWETDLILKHTAFTRFTPLRLSHAHGRMMYAFEKGGK
ncbi:Ubiquinone biosynthesis O-methyltransferase [subsurface metagenome]